jgi:NitT/TauT family transport system permease protein
MSREKPAWKIRLLYPLLGVAVALALWALATSALSGGGDGASWLVASLSPANTLRQLVASISSGDLPHQILPSLGRTATGLAIALVIGIPLGILVGYFPRMDLLTGTVFQFLRMTSPLAWMPVAILLFGIGDRPVIFLIALAAVWPVLLSTAHGVSKVDPQWIKVVRMLGGNDAAVLRRVIIPAIIPDIVNGARLAIGVAWIVLVPAEMLGVSSGLGYFLLDARDRFNNGELMAVILVIGALGFAMDFSLAFAQRKVAWSPRSGAATE